MEADLADILIIAKQRLPNLRVAFFSSRTYGGWAKPTAGSPEPYAYESGFAVRGLVQRQIKGDPALNYDPARGEVKAPVAVWGPYLWAKVTEQLLKFLKTDPGARLWFLKPGA